MRRAINTTSYVAPLFVDTPWPRGACSVMAAHGDGTVTRVKPNSAGMELVPGSEIHRAGFAVHRFMGIRFTQSQDLQSNSA